MRQLLLTTAVLAAPFSTAYANEPDGKQPETLSFTQLNQPQRVNWENKSDRIAISPVSAKPEQNNFAADSIDPENTKR